MDSNNNIDDPALPDPSMMDPTMADLFGEAGDGLSVPIPPVPLPAATILRIAEMQSRGCCTKLAWSSTGSIAQIPADGSKVLLRALARDGKSAMWTVTDPSKYPIDAPSGRKFVHVQFSGMGIDLVIADNLGGTYMYTLTGPLGRMVPATGDLTRGDMTKNELDAVVGLHWLPMYPAEFKGPYIETAAKNGDKWDFPMKQRDQDNKAHNPAEGRNAMFHISRASELTLLYQNEGQGWQSTSITLETVRSSDELVSHADVCEDGANLLVVTYDYSSRFRLYRITVHWNAAQHQRAPNLTYTLVSPSLEIHPLTASDNICAQHVDSAKLTHLRLIPAPPEVARTASSSPTVLAVFTQISLPTDAVQNQGSFSIISQWQVESFAPTLHESFRKLKPGSDSTAALRPLTVLRRQPDIVTSKAILTFESQIFDTILAFGASDGSVEFRDRTSMDSLQSFGDPSKVSSLSQTGFEHLPGEHNVHLALSIDGAAIALVRPNGKLDAHPMTFTHGWQMEDDGISDNKAFISAAEACVARQFAFLCYNNASNDESLALLPFDASLDARSRIIRNILKLMHRSPDISMHELNRQQMIVLKDPLIPRTLSAQLAFGTNPVTGERDVAAQYAFILLNLRAVANALAQTMIRPDVKTLSVEMFTTLCGIVRWFTELLIYILDTIVNVKRNLELGQSYKQAFEQLVSSSGNSVIHLLLCSFTRVLLRFSISWTSKYLAMTQQAVLQRARTVSERQELAAIVELATRTPFRYFEVEKSIGELDQAVRDAWTKSGITAERRGEIEASMVCDAEVPTELEPALNILMDTILPKLTENMDLNRLFFWQIEWLGISNSNPPAGKKHFDVHRKISISPGTSLRMCRRCGSVMEDLPPERVRELPQWLAHAVRHCVCMSFWILA